MLLGGIGENTLREDVCVEGSSQPGLQGPKQGARLGGCELQVREGVCHEEAERCAGARGQFTAIFMGDKLILASSVCP